MRTRPDSLQALRELAVRLRPRAEIEIETHARRGRRDTRRAGAVGFFWFDDALVVRLAAVAALVREDGPRSGSRRCGRRHEDGTRAQLPDRVVPRLGGVEQGEVEQDRRRGGRGNDRNSAEDPGQHVSDARRSGRRSPGRFRSTASARIGSGGRALAPVVVRGLARRSARRRRRPSLRKRECPAVGAGRQAVDGGGAEHREGQVVEPAPVAHADPAAQRERDVDQTISSAASTPIPVASGR